MTIKRFFVEGHGVTESPEKLLRPVWDQAQLRLASRALEPGQSLVVDNETFVIRLTDDVPKEFR